MRDLSALNIIYHLQSASIAKTSSAVNFNLLDTFLFCFSDMLSQCDNSQFVHPGISPSTSSMYLYPPQHPLHHHHHHHHFHHNHHHHLNTINVNMKIVSPMTPSLNAPSSGYAFQNSTNDDSLTYNRNCSSTSTNSSSSSFSNLSCNNNSSLNNSCNVVSNAVIKKEDSAILDNLYDEMAYQPNYYTNNGGYQLPEQNYLHHNSPSAASYYA